MDAVAQTTDLHGGVSRVISALVTPNRRHRHVHRTTDAIRRARRLQLSPSKDQRPHPSLMGRRVSPSVVRTRSPAASRSPSRRRRFYSPSGAVRTPASPARRPRPHNPAGVPTGTRTVPGRSPSKTGRVRSPAKKPSLRFLSPSKARLHSPAARARFRSPVKKTPTVNGAASSAGRTPRAPLKTLFDTEETSPAAAGDGEAATIGRWSDLCSPCGGAMRRACNVTVRARRRLVASPAAAARRHRATRQADTAADVRTMNKVATPREKTTSKNHHHRLQQHHHHQLQGKLAPPPQGSVSLEQLSSDSPAETEAAVAGGDAGAAVVTGEGGASSLPTLPTTAGTAEQLLWQQRQQQLIEAGRQELAALRAEIKRHKAQLSSGTAIGGSGAVSEPSVQQLHQLPRHHQLQLVEQLQAENKLLRSSLSEQLQRQGGEAAAPISDAEKQLLLANNCRARCSCSAPASIVGQDKTSRSSSGAVCMSKSASQEILMNSGQSQDWDKQSSSSMSEFSVADLQDRITQMEETHHSTNEELQATLQELQDLQLQLAADRLENQQLRQQKDVLMDSVLQLTARLDATSQQLQHLRQLLVSQEQQLPSEEDQQPGQADGQQREFMLRQLIKGTQSERDALQTRLENLQRRLDLAAQHDAEQVADRQLLADRVQLLEQQLQQAAGERGELEQQLQRQRQHAADCQIETERVQALLQNANGKIVELQQSQAANNRGELETLLDAARHEKSRVDERAADLQEQLSRAQCQLNKLTDEVAALQQHNKIVKNNAKKELRDADYRYDQLLADKNAMFSASQQLQENIHELEQTCQRHLQDKRQLKAGLSEHQKRAADLQQRLSCVQSELSGCRTRHQQDADEWKQFESDLLMSVRVANDFRTEAQLHVEQMAVDNHRLREQTTLLTGQLDTCRAELAAVQARLHQLQQHVRPAGGDAVVDCGGSGAGSDASSPPLGERRQPLRAVQSSGGSGDQTRPQRLLRQDSKLSVKTLIESLEAKQAQQPGSGSTSPTDSESLVHPQHPRLTSSASSPLFSSAVRSSAGGNPPASLHHVVGLAATAPSAGVGGTGARQFVRSYTDSLFSKASVSDSMKAAASAAVEDSSTRPLASILAHKLDAAAALRRGSYQEQIDKKDPLASLVKNGGSRRNALLKWCQTKTMGYADVDITNFSSSWNDGMALCALLHSYMPDKLPYSTLRSCDKRRNFNTAFEAAESVGIATTLNTNEMVSQDRPDWQQVLAYVTSIYRHFET